MIRVTPIKTQKGKSTAQTAKDVADYMKNEKETVDHVTGYYSKDQAPSMWLGEGAKALGLAVGAPVDWKQFADLLQGRLPDGTDLSKRGGQEGKAARLGTDITISAPKSLSIIAGHDPRVNQLWRDCVVTGVSMIQREVVTARMGHGGEQTVYTGRGVFAVAFHEETRMVDGTADMDWHAHVVGLNMTQRPDAEWSRVDLKWGGPEERMVLAKVVDFAIKAKLAEGLQQLGYPIRLTEDGFEIESVPQKILDENSRRTAQRNEWLTAHGIDPEQATDAQKTRASLATRGDKAQLGKIDQHYEWRDRLREQGLDMDRIIQEAKERGPIATKDLSLEAVRGAARHVGERETVFSRNLTRLEALKAGMGHTTLSRVDAAMVDERSGILEIAGTGAGGGKVTTRDALLREQDLLNRMKAGRGTVVCLATPGQVADVIHRLEVKNGYQLSSGQKAAIELGMTTKDRVIAIEGAWGSGKTTGAMEPIVAHYRACGYHAIALAPTTDATLRATNMHAHETRTLASWLTKPAERGPDGEILRDEARVIIVDESGMVDAATMDAIMKKLAVEGGRLVLTGDYHQQRSPGAGKPFQQAIETQAIASVRISQVQRQTDPRLKEMAQLWGDGRLEEASAVAREFVHSVTVTDVDWQAANMDPKKIPPPEGDRPVATDAMLEFAHALGMKGDTTNFEEVRAWLDAHPKAGRLGFDAKGKAPKIPREVRLQAIIRETAEQYLAWTPEQRADMIVKATTNHLRVGVNETIHKGLQQEGTVGREEVKIVALDKVDTTAEKLARAETYNRAGLVVRMGYADSAVDYKVVGVEKNRVLLEKPDGTDRWRWDPATDRSIAKVYTARELPLAVGDEIRFRDSVGSKGSPDRVDNGERAHIVRLTDEGPVARTVTGQELTLRTDQNHPVDYGYCRTVQKVQGDENERGLLAAEATSRAAAQTLGVACTRGKEGLTVVTDNPEKLMKQMQKWATHESALEATKGRTYEDLVKVAQGWTLEDFRAEAREHLGRVGDLGKARDSVELLREAEAERQAVGFKSCAKPGSASPESPTERAPTRDSPSLGD